MDGGVVGCLKLLLLEILTYYLLCHMCSMQAKHDAMMKLLSPTVIVQTHANSPTTHPEWGAVIDKLYQNERFMDRPSKDKGLEIVRCR